MASSATKLKHKFKFINNIPIPSVPIQKFDSNDKCFSPRIFPKKLMGLAEKPRENTHSIFHDDGCLFEAEKHVTLTNKAANR